MQPDWKDVLRYAKFSDLVYSDPTTVVDTCLALGYVATCIETYDNFCFIAESKDENIICFRGSDSLSDLKTDLGFGLYRNKNEWHVHDGFYSAWKEIQPKVVSAINHCDYKKPFVICGHSLGGALAILSACYLSEFIHNISVCTIACPRVGRGKFKKLMEDHMKYRGLSIINIANNGDIVPSLPWKIFGWKTIGNLFKIGNPVSFFDIPNRIRCHTRLRYIRNIILQLNSRTDSK